LRELKLAGETAPDKLKRIRVELKKIRADALLVSDPQNVAWAFNIRGADVTHTPLALAFALIPQDARPSLYIEAAKLDNQVRHAIEEFSDVRVPEDLTRDLDKLNGKVVRLDQASASDALTRLLTDTGGKPQRGTDPIALLKATKNHAEIVGSRAAHKRDGVALARFLAWFDKEASSGKLTEIDAVAALESFRRDTGALKDISFPTIAGAGPNGAIVHYRVTRSSNRRIGTNELFLIDSGAQYEDGTTDITRTVIVGEPSEEMRNRGLSGKHQRRTARPTCPHRAMAGRPRFRPRHWTWRRQLSVGARGSGTDIEIGDRRTPARDDPVERTGLLQNSSLRHSHRKSGPRYRRAGACWRRKTSQCLRDAHACADRPADDRNANADDEGTHLARQLSRARARGHRPPGRQADADVAHRGDAVVAIRGPPVMAL
jgi:Xaa-Pro aminopeptidase